MSEDKQRLIAWAESMIDMRCNERCCGHPVIHPSCEADLEEVLELIERVAR